MRTLVAVTALFVCLLGAKSRSESNYESYYFGTVAGAPPYTNMDGPGAQARFKGLVGVATDGNGVTYIAESSNQTIRKIAPDGTVSTLAGLAGNAGSVDGSGSVARFNYPAAIAVDSGGILYVADNENQTIRKVTPSGMVSTFAGLAGSPGVADGMGSAARFNYPQGIAVDGAGTVYVADTNASTIRKISSGGDVTTFAGGIQGSADGIGNQARFLFPTALTVDNDGNLYVADTFNSTIRKITPDAAVSTLAGSAGDEGSDDGIGNAARFAQPAGLAVDAAGNLYVGDRSNHTIRKVTPGALVTTLAGLGGAPGDADGNGIAARFYEPFGVSLGNTGSLYVADTSNGKVRKISATGDVSTVAGFGLGTVDGVATAARFRYPYRPAVDTAGNIYVTDLLNHSIRKITPTGVVTTFAGQPLNRGSEDGASNTARFYYPDGIGVDSAGNVYVADSYNATIRKISPNGIVSTLAGLAGNTGAVDGTGSAARFQQPGGLALDGVGNIYVTDFIANTVRKIMPEGMVTTLAGRAFSSGSADGSGSAARFLRPSGISVDTAGNLYVADRNNHTIRKVSASGIVSTWAGLAKAPGSSDGTGTSARFNYPGGVAVDGLGNVYVTDSQNRTLRKIAPSATVTTLAGSVMEEGSADGTGNTASFNNPFGVTISGESFMWSTAPITISGLVYLSVRPWRPEFTAPLARSRLV